jgi:hypothetical protein
VTRPPTCRPRRLQSREAIGCSTYTHVAALPTQPHHRSHSPAGHRRSPTATCRFRGRGPKPMARSQSPARGRAGLHAVRRVDVSALREEPRLPRGHGGHRRRRPGHGIYHPAGRLSTALECACSERSGRSTAGRPAGPRHLVVLSRRGPLSSACDISVRGRWLGD